MYFWASVFANVQLSKGANVANADDVNSVVAQEVDDGESARTQAEEKNEWRHERTHNLLHPKSLKEQQQHSTSVWEKHQNIEIFTAIAESMILSLLTTLS